MKNVFILFILFYQRFISPLLHQLLGVNQGCRHTPTCSLYAQTVIDKYGVGKGLLLSIKRLLSCQPFFSI
jgi:uncharacterized protein